VRGLRVDVASDGGNAHVASCASAGQKQRSETQGGDYDTNRKTGIADISDTMRRERMTS